MMCRQLLYIAVVCLLLGSAFSIQCYEGIDNECLLASNLTDCGEGAKCQCAKFRYECSEDDNVCNEDEQSSGAKIWIYGAISKSTCRYLKKSSSVFSDVTCCSKDKCNKPADADCFEFERRHLSRRKLNDLVKLER